MTKYVKSIKFSTSGETYVIRDAEQKSRLDTLEPVVATKADSATVDAALAGKQATLVSGENIKTINNQSILGSGNITIGGSGGTTDYDQLDNRPQIAGTTLTGNKSLADLGIAAASDLSGKQDKLTSANAGSNVTITEESGVVKINATGGSGGTSDYTDLTNKPQINGHELSGNKSATDLELLTSTDLANYYTKTEADAEFLTSNDVGTMASESKDDYYTKTAADTEFLSSTDVGTMAAENKTDYYTKSEADAEFVTSNDLANYYTKSETDNGFITSKLDSILRTSEDWQDLEPYFTQTNKRVRWTDGSIVDQTDGYIAIFKIHANQQIEILTESTKGYPATSTTAQAVIAHSEDGETWIPDERGYHDSEGLYYNHFGHTYDKDCYVALSGLYGSNYATPKFRVKNLPLQQNTQTEFSCINGLAVTGDSQTEWYFVCHGTTSIKGALFYIPLNPESNTIRLRIINPFENIKFNTQMVYGVKGHWAFRTTGSSVTITNNEFTLNHNSADTLAVSFVKSSGTITEEELAAIKLKIVYEGRARSADGNTAFMNKVQQKATFLGMTNSTFVNPYGGSTYGYNVSTVRDLMKMTVHAMDYRELKEISTLTSYTVQILGPNARTVVLTNNLQQTMDSWYQSTRGVANPYTLLLQKPGGWSSGAQKGFSLCAVTKVGDVLVAASTGTTDGTGTTGRECRWRIMLDLFDICKKKLDNTYAGETLTYNDGETEFTNLFGCACILPSNPGSYGNKPLEILYEQNADVQFNPASCSKMIASMVMVDTVPSLYETHNIRSDEIVNDSNYVAQIEDIEDMYTSLAIMYLASNGSNTLSAARYCGEKILAEQQKAYPNLSIG